MKMTRKSMVLGGILILVLAPLVLLCALKLTAPQKQDMPEEEPVEQLEWFVASEQHNQSITAQSMQVISMLEQVLGKEISISFGSVSRLISKISADQLPNVITTPYDDPQVQSLSQAGTFLELNRILSDNILGAEVSETDYAWQMDYSGSVYAVVNGFSVQPSDYTDFNPSVVMLARSDLMKKYDMAPEDFQTKEGLIQVMKNIRKSELETIPCLLDLDTLVKMFGAREEDDDGNWQDPFFQPQTLEAIHYLNNLYHEKMLPKSVFTLGTQQVQQLVANGQVFLISGSEAAQSAAYFSRRNGEQAYTAVGPILPDSGTAPRFPSIQKTGSEATMFSHDNDSEDVLKILTFLYINYHPVSLDQELILRKQSWYPQIKHITPAVYPEQERSTVLQEYSRIVSPYTQMTDYTFPYEILFTYRSNTHVGDITQTVEKYKQSQLEKMVFAGQPEEVDYLYQTTVNAISSMNYDIVVEWKQRQYAKAKALAGVDILS